MVWNRLTLSKALLATRRRNWLAELAYAKAVVPSLSSTMFKAVCLSSSEYESAFCVYECVCVCVSVCECTCLCVCVCVCVCACVCVSVYG